MNATQSSHPGPRPVSTLAGALWDEYEAIHGKPRTARIAPAPIDPAPIDGKNARDPALQDYYDAVLQQNQSALCLSGGGIRSAAFSLGVLRALASQKLLTEFHYLSTVSGGGYIGGWLSAMINAPNNNARKVQGSLAADEAPPELQALRGYTNFLSPRPGLSSVDTWAGIVLWVRNVLVNWMVFLPALLALALLPNLYVDWITGIGPGLGWPLLAFALLCLGVGVYNGAAHLPSHGFPEPEMPAAEIGFVPLRTVVPVLAWSLLAPLVAAPWLREVMPANAVPGDLIPLLAFLTMEAAYAIAALRRPSEHRRIFWRNLGWWTLASLAASAGLWLALDLGIGLDPRWVAVLGPLAITLAHLVQSLVYAALRVEAIRGDLDREWLARLNALKVIPALIWALFAAACLLLPELVLDRGETVFYPFLMSAAGLLTGPLAAYIGKISKNDSGAEKSGIGGSGVSLSLILNLIAVVFAASLFMLLGRLGAILLSVGPLWLDSLVFGAIVLLAWRLGEKINVNRFSMHAVYRSRIVRGFLGTARRCRNPDKFTDIDPHDNPRMADLKAEIDGKRRLFPVVGVTLNLAAGHNTAWTERKGESFTITPTACGAAYLHRKEDVDAGLPERGAYVRTRNFAGSERTSGQGDLDKGISLGTAITLSGAAVSPSMGYHSSPATAFLMTLFNVRLGGWLPNPAKASTEDLQQSKPPNSVLTLARELLGRTHERGSAVYLTDGGHFDNLGLYEMVRRRCRTILVVDAGEDPKAKFEDLGAAVRKIRIDQDIDIKFDPPLAIVARGQPNNLFRSFACATIHYPESKITGRLIYIKPCDPADMPMDVRSFRNMNDAFPHDPTANQFFSESMFESYRQLGEFQARSLAPEATTLEAWFDTAAEQLRK